MTPEALSVSWNLFSLVWWKFDYSWHQDFTNPNHTEKASDRPVYLGTRVREQCRGEAIVKRCLCNLLESIIPNKSEFTKKKYVSLAVLHYMWHFRCQRLCHTIQATVCSRSWGNLFYSIIMPRLVLFLPFSHLLLHLAWQQQMWNVQLFSL